MEIFSSPTMTTEPQAFRVVIFPFYIGSERTDSFEQKFKIELLVSPKLHSYTNKKDGIIQKKCDSHTSVLHNTDLPSVSGHCHRKEQHVNLSE